MATVSSREHSLVQLVYVSAASIEFSKDDLEQLLVKARRNNQSLGITGVLLFADGTFFQVLEGEPSQVQSLFEHIEQDPRHSNVLILNRETVEERNFGDWSMGFISDKREIALLPGLEGFLQDEEEGQSFLRLHGKSRYTRRIIDGFRRGRWRRASLACAVR